MKQLSQKRADQKLAKELKRERKKANKAVEEKNVKEANEHPNRSTKSA